jgi:hypothetical protein
VFENNNNCTFRIHVFAPRASLTVGRFIVEVQRRSGCVVSFANFYRSLIATLGGNVVTAPYDSMATIAAPLMTPKASSLPPLPPLSSPTNGSATVGIVTMPLPSSQVTPPTSPTAAPTPTTVATSAAGVLLDDVTINCLVDMATARDVDIQREAIRALATASSLTTNQVRLLAFDKARSASPTSTTGGSGSRLVDMLGSLLGSNDVEVSRCAAMLTANMGTQSSSLPQLLSVIGALLLLLETSTTATNHTTSVQLAGREARRQAARALAAICSVHAATIRKDRSGHVIVAAIDRHAHHAAAVNDEACKSMLQHALSSLLPSSFSTSSTA